MTTSQHSRLDRRPASNLGSGTGFATETVSSDGPPSRDGVSDGVAFGELLAAARQGCRASTGELIDRFRPYLLLIANQDLDFELRPKVAASDIVQEVMLSAQHRIADFRGATPEELRGWLRRIVINDILANRRRFGMTLKRQLRLEVTFADPAASELSSPNTVCSQITPSSSAVAREESERLYRAIETLAEDRRRVLRLRHWQQLSFPEVGREMNRTPEAARKLWSRAVVELKRALDRDERTPPPAGR